MPISFTCPHCGKQTSVSEQYAGQTGPCASCGKPVTVPAAFGGPGYSYTPARSGGGGASAIIVVLAIALGGSVVVCGILAALLLPAVQAAREAARRVSSQNNLRQLSIAMLNYQDTYKDFPPAVVRDANGQPLYSGRVLLLPFIEQNALFEQWDPTQAWDSPRNMPISQTALSIFCDPSGDAPSPRTDYLFVVGTGTAFEESMKQNIASLKDGTANTLFMIEAKSTGINWAEPRDFDASQPVPLPPGNHPRVNLGAFFDGSVKAISSDMPPEDVRALATRDGGETVFPN